MANRNALYDLVKSLSAEETKYFTKYAKVMGGSRSTNYLKYFQRILKLKEYNDNKWTYQVDKGWSKRKASEIRSYLYHTLLKTLRNYWQDNLKDNELINHISSIEVLIVKGLLDNAAIEIKQLKTKAYHSNRYFALLKALEWEGILSNRTTKSTQNHEIRESTSEEFSFHIEQYKQLEEAANFSDKVNNLFFRIHTIRSEEDELEYESMLNHPSLQSFDEHMPARAVHYYYTQKVALLNELGHSQKAYTTVRKHIKFVLTNDIAKKNLNYHFTPFMRQLELSINMDDHQMMKQSISEFTELNLVNNSQFGVMWLVTKSYFELYNLIRSNKIEEANNYVKNLQQDGFMEIGKSYPSYHYQTIFLMMWLEILNGKPDKALEYYDLVEATKNNIRVQIWSFFILVKLIAYVDKNEWLLVAHMAENIYRYLHKHDLLFESERLLLNMIKKSAKIPYDDLPENWMSYEKKFEVLKQNQYEKRFFKKWDITVWLSNKIKSNSSTPWP